MRKSVEIFAKEEEESWCATPSAHLLREIHEDVHEGAARWIACIGDVRIALGDPVKGMAWRKELHLPQWILAAAGVQEGDVCSVRFERSGVLPEAEHLNLKVLGELPEDWDLRATLEEPLSQLGVLQEGQILPCPMLEGVSLLVQICQPAGPVFLHGNEVSLEIEYVTQQHPPQPVVQPEQKPAAVDESFSMLPPSFSTPSSSSFQAFQGTGHRLR